MKHIHCLILFLAQLCVAQGVRADDIIITTTDELNAIATAVNSGTNYSGITIKLANDLNYSEASYTPIGCADGGDAKHFAGYFDGQGHTISGINITNAQYRQGIFGTVKNGTVCNLIVANSTFNGSGYCGGIVGTLVNGTIENCHVRSSVTVQSTSVSQGGIAGQCKYGNIIACTSAAVVKNSNSSYNGVGGILGLAGDTSTPSEAVTVNVSKCFYYGSSLDESETKGRHGAIVGFVNRDHAACTTALTNNFYYTTQAGIYGVGYEEKGGIIGTQTNFDETTSYGASRVRIVTSSDDIADMGDAGVQYVYDGITPYTYGVKFGKPETYYSHVLALENAANNSTTLAAYNGHTYDVILRGRTLYKDGFWNTVSLPFSVGNNSIFRSEDGCTVREFDVTRQYYPAGETGASARSYKSGCEDGKLYLFFKRVYALEAGTPYIVMWNRDKNYNENDPACDHVDPMFRNVEIDITQHPVRSKDRTVTYTPTYNIFTRDVEDRSVLFLGAANTLYYPSGAGPVSVKPFRAYFQLSGVEMKDAEDTGDEEFVPEGGGDVKAFVIDLEEMPTGVNGLSPDPTPVREGRIEGGEAWYTLDGRRISLQPSAISHQLPKGLYIVNGRKVLVK